MNCRYLASTKYRSRFVSAVETSLPNKIYSDLRNEMNTIRIVDMKHAILYSAKMEKMESRHGRLVGGLA